MLNRQLLRKLKLPMNFISNLGGPTNMHLVQKGLHGYNMHLCSLAVASNPGFLFWILSHSFGKPTPDFVVQLWRTNSRFCHVALENRSSPKL